MITITMAATYETVQWEEECEEPDVERGYTDPSNPWGGWRYAMPESMHGEAARAWIAENAETVTFHTLQEAAQFVADFPGGVWAYSECWPEQDTGAYTTVTLHVDGFRDAVFAIAHAMEASSTRTLQQAMGRTW